MKKIMRITVPLITILFSTSLHSMLPLFAQKILCKGKAPIHRALFSPRDPIKDVLLGLIESEKKSISVACYALTEPEIAKALIKAHERKVTVRIVLDRSMARQSSSKVEQLFKARIPLWICPASPEPTRSNVLMHNKILIFSNTLGRELLVTGSLNLSDASARNHENMVFLQDPSIIKQYKDYFGELFIAAVKKN